MQREEIKAIIPHREHMLLLDDVEKIDEVAVGHYKVRGDEFFLQGHFPGNPIVPGVILCEILAQTACVLVGGGTSEARLPESCPEGQESKFGCTLYTGLDKVRFRSPVRPGDTVETRCSIRRVKAPFYFAEGTVCVDGTVCVSAEFSFALTGA